MKAIAYIRVSTDEQAQEERFSLQHQREHIQQECKARGWDLIAFYEDTESGKSTRKRKGFQAAIEAMKSADVLVVHELDRFSRNFRDTIIHVDDLIKAGKKLLAVHGDFDLSTAAGEMQFRIIAMFSDYFRAQLGAKVHGGMTTKAKGGEYNTKPPLGYMLKNKKLVINPDEAWIIKKIFDMYLENKGTRAIAEELNSLGVRTRQGALWSPFPIRNMLQNQVYIGNTVWNKTKRNDTKDIKRPEEDWIAKDGTHEPIIDKEIFFQAQERMKRKSELGGRVQSSNYLLSGLLKCGHCNSPMIGNTYKGRTKKSGETPVYQRYICSGYHKQGICHFVYGHCEEVDHAVKDRIKAFLGTPDEVKLLQKKTKIDLGGLMKERDRLNNELSNIDRRYDRQYEAFEAGLRTLEQLKGDQERVNNQKKVLKKELSKLETKLNSLDRDDIIKRNLSGFYKVFGTHDIPTQKAWLQQHVDKIIFKDIHDILITFKP